jgi:hypothetical protein
MLVLAGKNKNHPTYKLLDGKYQGISRETTILRPDCGIMFFTISKYLSKNRRPSCLQSTTNTRNAEKNSKRRRKKNRKQNFNRTKKKPKTSLWKTSHSTSRHRNNQYQPKGNPDEPAR